MVDFFQNFSPITQAFIATLFTWGMTALGASIVFTTKTLNQRLLDSMLGFAGGVMIAASYWSLLGPAIEMSEGIRSELGFQRQLDFYLVAFFYGESIRFYPIFIPIPLLMKRKDFTRKKEKKVHCWCLLLPYIIFQKD